MIEAGGVSVSHLLASVPAPTTFARSGQCRRIGQQDPLETNKILSRHGAEQFLYCRLEIAGGTIASIGFDYLGH